MSLQNLRQAPQQAMAASIYYLIPPQGNPGPTSGLTGQQGLTAGLCKLVFTPIGGGGGIDYFFPYTHGAPQGVTVPAAPAAGALALTTGMNGCALEVVVKNGNYVFYHDRNATSMGLVQVAGGIGTTVCRIGPNIYWDQAWATSVALAGRTPQYQMVCVYRGGFWHVACYRTATSGNGAVVYQGGPGLGLNGSYIGYFNQNMRLIRP